MVETRYALFVDDELTHDKRTLQMFNDYSISGVIIPTSEFSSALLKWIDQDGKEMEIRGNKNIQSYICANYSPYRTNLSA